MQNRIQRHVLAVDLGTGSIRAAIVSNEGKIQAVASQSLTTYTPSHGRVEQRPEDWWLHLKSVIAELFLKTSFPSDRLDAVCVCGHMHAVTPITSNGDLALDRVGLWNDKRAQNLVDAWKETSDPSCAINPPTTAWPAFKLAWYRDNMPDEFEQFDRIMMPKDYINFRLTGEIAMDRTEAGSSFLADESTVNWSETVTDQLGIDTGILPPILRPDQILGHIHQDAALETGLPQGLPVVAGGGDYPVAVLGSGVCRPGQASDITGTSFLFTLLAHAPVSDPHVMNVASACGRWGSFAVVDAAGDAVRWAARVLESSNEDYAKITEDAATISAGCDGLMFLPYLTGERLDPGARSRGGFHGISVQHTASHFHRAVMEGVALAMRCALDPLKAHHTLPETVIAAGGGARARTWLQIKASVLNTTIIPTKETECGLIGATALALAALEPGAHPGDIARKLIRYAEPVVPDPALVALYEARSETYKLLRDRMRAVDIALERETDLLAASKPEGSMPLSRIEDQETT